MKCPKSKEFFSFTPRSIHCEHNFDSEMHTADIVGVWRIIFVIRLAGTQLRDALKLTSLEYGQYTPFPLQFSSHASICMTQ